MSATTTKDRIDQSAIALFAQRGVDGTAVRDIAQAAGVADGALYRHYKSKDELCRRLFEHHYEKLGQMFESEVAAQTNLGAKLAAVIGTTYTLFDSDRALFTFILLTQHDHLPAIDKLSTTPVDAVCKLIKKASQTGEIAPCDPNEVTAMLFGLALQPAIFTIYGRLNGPLTKRADTIARACCRLLDLPFTTVQGSSK